MNKEEFIKQYNKLRETAIEHKSVHSYVYVLSKFIDESIPKLSDSCLEYIIDNLPKPLSAKIFQSAYRELKYRFNKLNYSEVALLGDYESYEFQECEECNHDY